MPTATNSAHSSESRDLRMWRIKDVVSRVQPEDMTDAELEAAIAIQSGRSTTLPQADPPHRARLGVDRRA